MPANLGAANSSEEAGMAFPQADCNGQGQKQNATEYTQGEESRTLSLV